VLFCYAYYHNYARNDNNVFDVFTGENKANARGLIAALGNSHDNRMNMLYARDAAHYFAMSSDTHLYMYTPFIANKKASDFRLVRQGSLAQVPFVF